jgi:hypothetical protein
MGDSSARSSTQHIGTQCPCNYRVEVMANYVPDVSFESKSKY